MVHICKTMHLTCLCGETFDVNSSILITCPCGNVINTDSLHFITLLPSLNVKLIDYCDTGRYDKDLFGEEIDNYQTKPIYRGFEFNIEYEDHVRWDDADSYLVATKLSDPSIKFNVYQFSGSYKKLFEKIDEYYDTK